MFKNGINIANRVFSLDNKVMRVFADIFDLVVLNLLFIISSLPIITLGVSLTAMYSVTLKMANNQSSSVTKDFIAAYKTNFKQGLLFGLIANALVIFLYIDFQLLQNLYPEQKNMLKVIYIALSLFGYFSYLYIFPLIARYVYTFKEVYQNGLKISLANVPWNLVLISLNIPIVGLILYSGMTMIIMCLIMIMVGFSGLALAQSYIYQKVFEKYE